MFTKLDRDCAEVLATCACESVRRADRGVTALYQHALASSDVRPAQLPILVAAHLAGAVPVTVLAERLSLDRTTLTRNLAVLEAAGLVRLEDHEDRRVRLVVLTPDGRAALEAAIESWRTAQARMTETFGPERLAALVAELAAFAEATRQ